MSFFNASRYDDWLENNPDDRYLRSANVETRPRCRHCGTELVNPTPVQTHCAACIAKIVADAKREQP